MASSVRIGLLGYGYAGRMFHAPLIQATRGIELRAVASRDPGRVRADLPGMRVHSDPYALIRSDEVDLIVVATPNDTHAPLARVAMRAGKHVVIEKPFCLDLDEARELLVIAEDEGLLLSVFHNRRWDSDYLSVRKAIAEGLIGEVVHFESHFDRFRPIVRDRWRERAGPGSGVWFDLGPHLVDQAVRMFGVPDRVEASMARQRLGSQTDDWAHVILRYGERRAVLQASMLAAGGSSRFIVHGRDGSLVKRLADPQEAQLVSGMRPGEPGWGQDPDALLVHRDGVVDTLEATPGDQRIFYHRIAEALHGSGTNPVAPMEALVVMAVVQTAINSAIEGRSLVPALTAQERASANLLFEHTKRIQVPDAGT